MTRIKRKHTGKTGFGFSGTGNRQLMRLFKSSVGAGPSDNRAFQNIFGQAIAVGLMLGCTVATVIWFGWLGLVIGPIVGALLAGLWLENDTFFS